MKKLIIFISVALNVSCVMSPQTHTDENMMPNGDWHLKLLANMKCSELYRAPLSPNETVSDIDLSLLFKQTVQVDAKDEMIARKLCMENFKKGLSSRATELCGEKFELYGCVNSEEKTDDSGLQYNSGYGYYMTCYLRCKK